MHNKPIGNPVDNIEVSNTGLKYNHEQDCSMGSLQSEDRTGKREWASPQLREYGNLSFVVKGISYNPNDGISNLTI